MIGDWLTYRAADFVPFTAEVYFRLIERVNASAWPLHLLTLSAAIAALALVYRGGQRFAALALAAMWGWVGYAFLLSEYASLNWAARPIAWAFGLQAVLLSGLLLSSRFGGVRDSLGRTRWVGGVLCLLGLSYPLLALSTGGGWGRAEVVGIHPDPTVLLTFGICLLTLRGWRLWASLILPVGWCLVSAITLWVLGVAWALPFAACAFVACLAGAYRRGPRQAIDDGLREAQKSPDRVSDRG
ncbi:MAG: DUF6064 family protein [Pseudomonadota bacterium]